MSKALFVLATMILAWGMFIELKYGGAVATVAAPGMNGFYLLAGAVYAAAVAAELIWCRRQAETA